MKLIIAVLFLLSLSQVEPTAILDALAGTLVLNKIAQIAHIPTLVSIDAEVEGNLAGNKIGADAAYGIGEKGSGAHASVSGDVLGQKANVHADIYDGHLWDKHKREILKDENGRYYVLVREYVGSQSVYKRRYLTQIELQEYLLKHNDGHLEEDVERNRENFDIQPVDKSVLIKYFPNDPNQYIVRIYYDSTSRPIKIYYRVIRTSDGRVYYQKVDVPNPAYYNNIPQTNRVYYEPGRVNIDNRNVPNRVYYETVRKPGTVYYNGIPQPENRN